MDTVTSNKYTNLKCTFENINNTKVKVRGGDTREGNRRDVKKATD